MRQLRQFVMPCLIASSLLGCTAVGDPPQTSTDPSKVPEAGPPSAMSDTVPGDPEHEAGVADAKVSDSSAPMDADAMPPMQTMRPMKPMPSTDPQGCQPECQHPTLLCIDGVCAACEKGTGRCEGDVPFVCIDRDWQAQQICGGSRPVCSNGSCSGVHIKGGVVTVVDAPAATGSIRVTSQHIALTSVSCGKVRGSTMCVEGGLIP